MIGSIVPILLLCDDSSLYDIIIQLIATLELNCIAIALTIYITEPYKSFWEFYRDKYGGVTIAYIFIEWSVFIIAALIELLNNNIEHSWFFLTFACIGLVFDATLIFLSCRDRYNFPLGAIVLLAFDILRNVLEVITQASKVAGKDFPYCLMFVSLPLYYLFPAVLIISSIILEYKESEYASIN